MTCNNDEADRRSGAGGLTRREALLMTLAAGVTATSITLAVEGAQAATAPFLHGVASGDPLSDRVVIWTRVTKPGATADIAVNWTVAEDAAFTRVARSGTAVARVGRDHTVKVDVANLKPGAVYYYRFETEGLRSPVGRTKTLPVGKVDRLMLAVFSCSNYELGFFNVYQEAAKRRDLDAVLHLGDYIYEYGPGADGYTTPATGLGLAPKPRDGDLQPRGDHPARPVPGAPCALQDRSAPAEAPRPGALHQRLGRPRGGERRVDRGRGKSQRGRRFVERPQAARHSRVL